MDLAEPLERPWTAHESDGIKLGGPVSRSSLLLRSSGRGRNRTGDTRIFRAFRQTVFSACFAERNQLLPALREIAKHRDEVPKITVFARVVKTESGNYRVG
jgi:hypothetical protein